MRPLIASLIAIISGLGFIANGFRLASHTVLTELQAARSEGRLPRQDVLDKVHRDRRASNYWWGLGGALMLMGAVGVVRYMSAR